MIHPMFEGGTAVRKTVSVAQATAQEAVFPVRLRILKPRRFHRPRARRSRRVHATSTRMCSTPQPSRPAERSSPATYSAVARSSGVPATRNPRSYEPIALISRTILRRRLAETGSRAAISSASGSRTRATPGTVRTGFTPPSRCSLLPDNARAKTATGRGLTGSGSPYSLLR